MKDADAVPLLLSTLPTQALRTLAADNEIDVGDRRVRSQLEEALFAHYATPTEILGDLDRSTLVGLCETFDLSATGPTDQLRERLGLYLAQAPANEEPERYDNSPRDLQLPQPSPVASFQAVGPWGAHTRESDLGTDRQDSPAGIDADDVQPSFLDRWWLPLSVGAAVMAVGRFANELDYLYPSRGNVIASGRRRNNPLAIAFKGITTLGGIAFVLLLILGSILGGIIGAFHRDPEPQRYKPAQLPPFQQTFRI